MTARTRLVKVTSVLKLVLQSIITSTPCCIGKYCSSRVSTLRRSLKSCQEVGLTTYYLSPTNLIYISGRHTSRCVSRCLTALDYMALIALSARASPSLYSEKAMKLRFASLHHFHAWRMLLNLIQCLVPRVT